MESHYHEGNLSDQYDGLVFVDVSSALKVVKLEARATNQSKFASQNGKRY